jgi:HlyD family secretion protein
MTRLRCAYILCILLFGCSGSNNSSATLDWGDFEATLTESGELLAVSARIVNMPDFDWRYGESKIVDLGTEGSLVKKGDFIAQIDTSNVVRELVQSLSDLAIAEADYQKMKIEHQAALRQLEAELQAAEAALRLANIDTLSVQFETKAKREQSRIERQMALLEVEKLTATLTFQKLIQKEEKTILEEKIKNHQRTIANARQTIKRFTILAPSAGMIVYSTRGRSRTKIAIGDEFWPGDPIIGLPDLSKMKAAITVNERDIKKVAIGQTATLRLDAFPQRAFNGRVISISKMCHPKERDSQIKVFDVEILLDENDPVLKPGMTISCEITVARLQDVFYTPLESVQEQNGRFYIYVERDGERLKVPVKIGSRNTHHVVIYGNLQKSDILLKAAGREPI